MRLTKRVIDGLTYTGQGNEQRIVWDDSLKGFGIRIYPSGRKAFLLSYRLNGRKHIMALGDYGVLTPDQARVAARNALVAVTNGQDPLGERQKAAHGETVADLCAAYMERYARPFKKSWEDDERRIRKYILPGWRNLKVAAIKRADVAALHSKIGKAHRYEANRVIELVSKMFSLAERWGFLPEDNKNPAHGIDHYKEEKRDRWITPEELPRLAEAIDRDESPYARAALWLYLLTGVRKRELLRSRWDDIDWTRKELRIPETKAGRTHYVPLSEPAISLLTQIPRMESNPHIIVGLKEGAHLVNIDRAWRRIRAAAGVEDVRLHDLRRTVGSWLAQAGNSLHLIGRVLNHSSQATTAVYARFAQDHVREALEVHGQRILGVAGKTPTAEVVPLPRPGRERRA
jgi:integrase